MLASLRYLHIERSGSGYRDSLKISDMLRTAPKIETLVIQVKLLSWSSRSSGLENVKCLKLVDTLVSPYDLKRILDSCSQLESFVFSLFAEIPRRSESIMHYFTGLQTLPQVLSVRQETLRYVALYWEPPPAGNDNGMNIAGSFKGLTNLETLILGGPGLLFEKAENEETLRTCLVNLLPQSIRSVTIDSENTSLQLLSLIDCGFFGQTLASKSQKKLHDLRYLHLEERTNLTSTRDLSTLENLFEMAPNIKTLVIESGVLEWRKKLHDSPKVPLASLTCLQFFNVGVNLKALAGILDMCGPLESFIYMCQRGGSEIPTTFPFVLSKSSSNSLRYLECCCHSTVITPPLFPLLRWLKTFERLQTLVLGGVSLSIGLFGEGTSHAKELYPTSLIELLPASIVNVRIDSKHLHKDMYQTVVALCQAKRAGSFPERRSILLSNFDVSQVPYTLGDLSELSKRYGVLFKQEATSVFPPPVARPSGLHWTIRHPRRLAAAPDQP
ncbi:hypothetical protein FBULB1_12262 [Fusarium bulbicola]|nr:hypothetical protein FBULB1_12262 [Fusarium bulbicola]